MSHLESAASENERKKMRFYGFGCSMEEAQTNAFIVTLNRAFNSFAHTAKKKAKPPSFNANYLNQFTLIRFKNYSKEIRDEERPPTTKSLSLVSC